MTDVQKTGQNADGHKAPGARLAARSSQYRKFLLKFFSLQFDKNSV